MSLNRHQRQALSTLMMATALADRHRIPTSTVVHPKGVIVPGDAFMTEKIADPDYVPYCAKCEHCQRLRRTVDGFACPECGNKANYDLTPFNGNVDVQYDGSEGSGIAPVVVAPTRDWQEDSRKKNYVKKDCGLCHQPFAGNRQRRKCYLCSQLQNCR